MESEKNHFWEYQCLDIHIARALTAPSLTLSTKIHVHFLVIQAAPFQHFGTDMYLHVIVRKKICFIIFCIKFNIYKKNQIFKKNSYTNLFFILLLYYTLTGKLYENGLSKKEKLQYFSNQKFLLIKQLSIPTHSTKLMILLLLNMLQQYSIHFI